jgi:hypothetical protein
MTGPDQDISLDPDAPLIAASAEASSVETAEAIEQAAAINDDPQVAEVLDHAATAADRTASRVGWVRGFISRLLPPSA